MRAYHSQPPLLFVTHALTAIIVTSRLITLTIACYHLKAITFMIIIIITNASRSERAHVAHEISAKRPALPPTLPQPL